MQTSQATQTHQSSCIHKHHLFLHWKRQCSLSLISSIFVLLFMCSTSLLASIFVLLYILFHFLDIQYLCSISVWLYMFHLFDIQYLCIAIYMFHLLDIQYLCIATYMFHLLNIFYLCIATYMFHLILYLVSLYCNTYVPPP